MLTANTQILPAFGLGRSFDRTAVAEEQGINLLRKMIWLYFFLLVGEGALRKWFLPALGGPLLIIRDPLVLLIYVQAIRCRRFPINGPMVAYFGLVLSFLLLALFQIIANIGGGPMVAAYGLRTNFLHLPLIFVIPQVFSYMDVVKLGRWVLILSVPMTILMALQFMAPPTSWINAATGAANDGKQIVAALGRIRPAGTFSFATGAAHFYVLVTVFLIFGLTQTRAYYSRTLLAMALISDIVVQPISGSRNLVLGCALIAVGAVLFATFNWGRAQRILVVAGLICAVMAALSMTSFFREAVMVFMTRWENASGGDAAGSLTARILSGFTEPFGFISEAGLFGKGLGMGTAAGSAMMTGSVSFLLAENEWSRVILESGSLLGFSFLAYRAWISGFMAVRAATSAFKEQNLLPWLLVWDACGCLFEEQISQPTMLGFMVLFCGLCLASMPPAQAVLRRERVARSEPVPERGLQFE